MRVFFLKLLFFFNLFFFSDDLEATRPVLERSLHWAREEKEKQISAAREAAAHELAEEEKRYVELHDDFVRLFASNIMLK